MSSFILPNAQRQILKKKIQHESRTYVDAAREALDATLRYAEEELVEKDVGTHFTKTYTTLKNGHDTSALVAGGRVRSKYGRGVTLSPRDTAHLHDAAFVTRGHTKQGTFCWILVLMVSVCVRGQSNNDRHFLDTT